MGVAVAPMVYTEPPGADYRARLVEAGYVLHEELELWIHPALDRALQTRIASGLTLDQIDDWIAAGR